MVNLGLPAKLSKGDKNPATVSRHYRFRAGRVHRSPRLPWTRKCRRKSQLRETETGVRRYCAPAVIGTRRRCVRRNIPTVDSWMDRIGNRHCGCWTQR